MANIIIHSKDLNPCRKWSFFHWWIFFWGCQRPRELWKPTPLESFGILIRFVRARYLNELLSLAVFYFCFWTMEILQYITCCVIYLLLHIITNLC